MPDTVLVHRLGGYGDYILLSAIIPFLQQSYNNIVLEVNNKGFELFGNDPRFSMVSVWEPSRYPLNEAHQRLERRTVEVSAWCQKHGWDFLNLYGTAEESCLAVNEVEAFQYSQDEREHRYNINLYDHLFKVAGIEIPDGWKHEQTIWYDDFEEEAMKSWRAKNPDHFICFCVMAGSGQNKIFPTWLEGFCKKLVDKLPKLKLFLFGDQDCTKEVWQYDRTVSMVHGTTKYPVSFKQSLLLSKYADFVFGPETGLLVGAGMMGTPKSMLFTLANKDQIVRYHRNDFSLQSSSECSPCYTLAYSGLFCPKESQYGLYPVCTDRIDLKNLRRTIAGHYQEWSLKHGWCRI